MASFPSFFPPKEEGYSGFLNFRAPEPRYSSPVPDPVPPPVENYQSPSFSMFSDLSNYKKPLDWFFNSSVLEPVSEALRSPGGRETARAFIPGYESLEVIPGTISGLGSMIGAGIDVPENRNLGAFKRPEYRDIIEREYKEGLSSALETVAPIDVATLGAGALGSSFKALKPISQGLNIAEGMYGAGQLGSGVINQDPYDIGIGALRTLGLGEVAPSVTKKVAPLLDELIDPLIAPKETPIGYEGQRGAVEFGGENAPLSENAKSLKDILKYTKTTKFNPQTIISSFENAGISVPEEMVIQIPKLLEELETSGWINKKTTGTYTLNANPPSVVGSRPVSPLGPESLNLEEALKSTKELADEGNSLSDIEQIKKDIIAKPVKEIQGYEAESIPVEGVLPEPKLGMEVPPKEEPKKLNSYTISLDDGTDHIVRAKTPEEAKIKAEQVLSDFGSEKKVTEIKEKVQRVSSLERAAKGETPPPKKPSLRPEGWVPPDNEKSLLDDITDLPKTLKSSLDISFPGRQGLFLLNRPGGIKAMGEGLKSLSEKGHLSTKANLESRPNKSLYEKFGLNQIEYDPTNISAESEQFPSQLAEKIPGVKQSQRVYNDQSNLMRANVFDDMTEKWSKIGKTPEKRPDLYTGLAKYLNVLTGRDPLPKKLAQAGHILNKLFWSPQFVKSRLQMLNPAFYAQLPKEVQKMAIRDVGGTIATLGGLLSAVAYAAKGEGQDVEFETNPNHTNFGKLKVGKTTYDFFSGLLPIIRTVSRITTGKKITPKGGEYDLEGGLKLGARTGKKAPFGQTAATELGGFVEGKTSPMYQIGKGILSGKGYEGEDYDIPTFLEDLGGPMGIMDIVDAWRDYDFNEGMKALPSLVGVGIQNERKSKFNRASRNNSDRTQSSSEAGLPIY